VKKAKIAFIRNFEPSQFEIECDIYLKESIKRGSEKIERMKVSLGELEPLLSTNAREMTEIGAFLFSLEKIIQRENYEIEKAFFVSSIDEFWNSVAYLIENIFLLLTDYHIQLEFIPYPERSKQLEKNNSNSPRLANAVSLFSGGVDSFVTFLEAKKAYENIVGLTIAHNQGILRFVNNIKHDLLKSENIQVIRLLNNIPKGKENEVQQTRGFTYLAFASAFCELYKCKKIIVGECGPLMFQPQIYYSDVVTRTTNKEMLLCSEKLFSKVYGKNIKIVTPFENNTKAEMISLLPKNIKRQKMRYFFSCFNPRRNKMCGYCYSCIVRKLSSIVAGAIDNNYLLDVCLYDPGKVKYLADLISLVRFCRDFMEDYERLPLKVRDMLKEKRKIDLFTRFALDIFAGLYILYFKNKVGKNVIAKKLIRNALAEKIVSIDQIEERINNVRQKNFPKPIF